MWLHTLLLSRDGGRGAVWQSGVYGEKWMEKDTPSIKCIFYPRTATEERLHQWVGNAEVCFQYERICNSLAFVSVRVDAFPRPQRQNKNTKQGRFILFFSNLSGDCVFD